MSDLLTRYRANSYLLGLLSAGAPHTGSAREAVLAEDRYLRKELARYGVTV